MSTLALRCPNCRLAARVDRLQCPLCKARLSEETLGVNYRAKGQPRADVMGCPSCRGSICTQRLACPHCGERLSRADRKNEFLPRAPGLLVLQVAIRSVPDPDTCGV